MDSIIYLKSPYPALFIKVQLRIGNKMVFLKNLIIIKLVLILLVFLPMARGAINEISSGAISGALAGAGRSSVDAGESYVLNPASIAHLRGSAISLGTTNSQPTTWEKEGSSQMSGWHLSLNENMSDSLFGSSIFMNQYDLKTKTDNNPKLTHFKDLWFSIASFVYPNFSSGISYRMHEARSLITNYQEQNFTLGFLWMPMAHLGIGFSFQNLKDPSNDAPPELTLGNTNGVGILYEFRDYLRFRLDLSRKSHLLPSQSMNEIAFGLENSTSAWLITRIGIGYQKNDDHQDIRKLTFGMGFTGPRFGLNYSLQQYQIAQEGQEHSIDLTIPF